MPSLSHKDAVKALNGAFSAPTVPFILPDELVFTIETFLDGRKEFEESDSQRLHEDLLALYNRHVIGDKDKLGPFLHVLRLLRPGLGFSGERLSEWWELVIKPTVDAIGHKRDEIDEAREVLLGILVFDEEDDKAGQRAQLSAAFTSKLLDAYLARTKIPYDINSKSTPEEDEFIARELEAVLVAYGRKKPKEFLCALDGLFVQKSLRAQALGLLNTFVRYQPPHLHLVSQTPLIQHLHKCLLIDTSSTIVDLALTTLIMFLPHIPGALVSQLPQLFLIYSRVLCWDRYAQPSTKDESTLSVDGADDQVKTEQPSDAGEDEQAEGEAGWEKLDGSFDNPGAPHPRPDYYFTFLYGLFPLNFMGFIRKARKYLENLEFPGADDLDIDQDLLRRRTETLRRVHVMHPNFFSMTMEDELTDNRWLKADPADIVMECLGLCIAFSALNDPGPPPKTNLPEIPKQPLRSDDTPPDSLLNGDEDSTAANKSSWRNTHSTTLTEPPPVPQDEPIPPRPTSSRSSRSPSHPKSKSSRGTSPAARSHDSPTLPPMDSFPLPPEARNLDSPFRPNRLQNKTSVAASLQSTGSPKLESFAQILSRTQFSPEQTRNDELGPNLASLQREVMLLRNDLNFERYLKQQHMSHIGQLQRRHIKEAATEAETQNQINTIRTLKTKLAKANELYNQMKKETSTSRSQSKKWEADLTVKVRAYREEQRQWRSDEATLRLDFERARADAEQLRRLVAESDARELLSKQKLQSLELDMEELQALRDEAKDLQAQLNQYQLKEMEFEQASEDLEILRNELNTANLKLSSRDADRERSRKAYDRKIADLEAQLQASNKSPATPNGPLPPAVQQMVDSALAASRSRMEQLRRAHTQLLHKYTELEIRNQELEGERMAGSNRPGSRTDDFDFARSNGDGSSSIRRQNTSRAGSRNSSVYPSDFHRAHPFSDTSQAIDEHYDEHDAITAISPVSPRGHGFGDSAIPARLDSLQNYSSHEHSAAQELYRKEHGAEPVRPSSQSAFSHDSNSSKGDKPKVAPQSQVRVYGRGGAQNIGVKAKDKTDKKDKQPKSGTFRIRGII